MPFNVGGSYIIITRSVGDLRYAILVSSNAYRDREDEIVSEKALQDATANYEGGQPLLLWHSGEPIGEITSMDMMSSFLVEVAKELPNKLVNVAAPGEAPLYIYRKDVWDAMEQNPQEWGVSIGFKYRKGDEQDTVYDRILKFESSVLPLNMAANILTAVFVTNSKEQL